MQKKCGNCRFWSELVAWAKGGGPVHALCLSETSLNKGKETSEGTTCPSFAENLYGAIDDPKRTTPYPGDEDYEPEDHRDRALDKQGYSF
jgi:hypothetical protein